MKHVELEKLWGMISRIDSAEKAKIAEQFLRECDLTNEEFDDLMIAVSQQYRWIRLREREERRA